MLKISENEMLVCKQFVSKEGNDVLIFKGFIKDSIDKKYISPDDAKLIVLELMYNVNHYICDFKKIQKKSEELVLKVKKYNLNNEENRKKSLFNKDYAKENAILKYYLSKINSKRRILKNDISSKNRSSAKKINFYKNTPLKNEKNSFDSSKIIKEKLDQLSRNDLCYILGENPKLNYSDKEETLKKLILSKIGRYSINMSKVKYHSNDDVKNYLKELINNDRDNKHHKMSVNVSSDGIKKSNFLRSPLQVILEKTNEFNEMTFPDMFLFRSDYFEIYEEVTNNNFSYSHKDIKKFIYYFTHFDEIKEAVKVTNKLNKFDADLSNFHSKINGDCYLAYSDVKKIVVNLEKSYPLVLKINDFHYFIKTKISKRFENVNYFMDYYGDLKQYLNFDEISEDNPKLNVNNKIYKNNQDYIENGVKKYREFFENFYNGKSLDDDQIRAVLTDNDATQIIAGAGTGKTLTLQGKVKFLIEEKKILPEDILCISYSVSSKEDLKDKIEKTIGKTNIEVKTFHSVGSKILKINEEKCRVKENALNHAIDLYFKNVVFKDQKLMQSIVTFFSSYFKNTEAQLNNYAIHQTMKSMIHSVDNTTDYDEMRVQDENKVTIDREYVRSVEELIIANFLYIHGIDYIYEKEYSVINEFYEKNLENYLSFLFFNCEYIPRNIKMELYYKIGINIKELKFGFYPDFYLPRDNIYLEHFGVDRNCEANWLKTKQLKENYKNAMNHKKKIYNENNTKFIATYSFYNQENRLTERLEEKLREYDVEIQDVNYESIFKELILNGKLKEYSLFKRVISTFINLFKGNGIYLDKNGNDISEDIFKKFKTHNEDENEGDLQKRTRIFLNLIEEIYNYYNNILKEHEKIDFDDMINNATIAIKNGAKVHNYKYIIVDEYQDTSHTRYNLLKELQKRTNAKIIVVGDDWQSIFGFTGCDIHLFSNFKQYFKNPSIVKIQNTYRNSQALIDIAGKFIQNNPLQIKKELSSSNKLYKLPVKLARYTDPIDEILMFIYILREINKKAIRNPKKTEVLVLGRNNFDIEEIICQGLFETEKLENETIIIPKFEEMNLDISFRTIHKSKGLEANYVILLNLNDKLAGFPNKIEDDPILDYVTIKKEEIRFAEERRLFYVALTRTLNDIYLLAPENKSSEFILELELGGYILDKIEHNYNDNVFYDFVQKNINKRMIEIPTGIICPKCKFGEVKLLFNTKKGTKFFRCSERCGWNGGWYFGDIKDVSRVRVCNECNGMIVLKTSRVGNKYMECNFHKKRHLNFKKYR